VIVRVLRPLAAAMLVAAAAGCGRSDAIASDAAPLIRLVPKSGTAPARVEVAGLSADLLRGLTVEARTSDQWPAVFRVSVVDDTTAVLGSYDVAGNTLRFTPAFPFDPGRQYDVRFDPSSIQGSTTLIPLVARVGLPPRSSSPSTVVERVYPSGDVVPENLLRLYIEFSAPMEHGSGIGHLALLDDAGTPVEGAFLPLDYEFWSPDRRRLTVFFDPGRVKDGILPNRQKGRPLHSGRSYTLVVDRKWRDGEGLPLKEEFRRVLHVGPARAEPLDTSTWRVTPPIAGGRTALVVTFREALDHGLMLRALGVRLQGTPVAGDIQIEAGEQRWVFTPDRPWRAGTYQLLALSILEDVAGNQIGRAFEVDNFETVDKDPDPKTVLLPFTVAASS
jgi:hypothetical protein